MYFYVQESIFIIMHSILDRFEGMHSQKLVAKTMLRYGLRVEGEDICCGRIRVADASLARVAGVDRRVVRSTVERINSDPELLRVFSKLNSTSLLSDVAPEIGCSVIEIVPTNAKQPGILAEITQAIFDAGVSVRQVVVDDFAFDDGPRLIIVLDGQLPTEYIPRLKACQGVSSVILR